MLKSFDRVEGHVVIRHEYLCVILICRTHTVDLVEAHHAAVIQHHRRVVHEAAALEAVQLAVLAEEVWELTRECLFANVLHLRRRDRRHVRHEAVVERARWLIDGGGERIGRIRGGLHRHAVHRGHHALRVHVRVHMHREHGQHRGSRDGLALGSRIHRHHARLHGVLNGNRRVDRAVCRGLIRAVLLPSPNWLVQSTHLLASL